MGRILCQIVHLEGVCAEVVELVIVEAVVDEFPIPVPQEPLGESVVPVVVFDEALLVIRCSCPVFGSLIGLAEFERRGVTEGGVAGPIAPRRGREAERAWFR